MRKTKQYEWKFRNTSIAFDFWIGKKKQRIIFREFSAIWKKTGLVGFSTITQGFQPTLWQVLAYLYCNQLQYYIYHYVRFGFNKIRWMNKSNNDGKFWPLEGLGLRGGLSGGSGLCGRRHLSAAPVLADALHAQPQA